MKRIIVIIGIVISLLVLVGGGYFMQKKQQITTSVKNTDVVKPVVVADEEADKLLLNNEIKTKLEFFNKSLKPNYLKIVDFKEFQKLGAYEDGVTFYQIKIDYDITEDSMADYDVLINKGSISEADFKSKTPLYKQNLERTMKNLYYPAYGYDRLVNTGIIGYIEKGKDNSYIMYELGDYIKNRFGKETIDVNVLGEIELLKDYFNYQPIFFDKDPKEVLQILKNVEKSLKNDKFSKLYPILVKLYFSNIDTNAK